MDGASIECELRHEEVELAHDVIRLHDIAQSCQQAIDKELFAFDIIYQRNNATLVTSDDFARYTKNVFRSLAREAKQMINAIGVVPIAFERRHGRKSYDYPYVPAYHTYRITTFASRRGQQQFRFYWNTSRDQTPPSSTTLRYKMNRFRQGGWFSRPVTGKTQM